MAKDKKWIDCPLCGTKGSMVFHKDISRTYKSKNIKKLWESFLWESL